MSAAMGGPERVAVTFFDNFAAASKREENYTLPALASRISATTASEKKRLPWLKLARFGDTRTDKNSLRHDGNMIAISGLEADYDGGTMTMVQAAEILTQAGVIALLYSSPSNTEAAPRWRVLCPLSGEFPPGDRDKFMGRLNGLFRGVFAAESWALSQSYYYGSIRHNPQHRVEIIEGTPIDEHDELDVVWTGRPNTAADRAAPEGEHRSGPVDEAALLAEIVSGSSYHTSAVRLLGRWARQGVPYMDARARLVDAMESVFPPDRDARWHSRRADVDRCLDDIYGKAAKTKDQAKSSAHSKSEDEDTPDRRDEPKAEPEASVAGNAGIRAVVAEFNDRFMVVNEGGRAIIYQPITDPVLHRRRYDRLAPTDLKILYQNKRVAAGKDKDGNTVYRQAANVWLAHPDRRQFVQGVTFDPSGKPAEPGVLNLWQGFAVKPKPGTWSLLKTHIRDVICCGNLGHFDYLIGWMARMVQHPAEQGEVAVVMCGGEGIGKGTLARALLPIMGQHGLAISNAKHLVGNFNGHLRDAILLFADEAFFAGDKSHIGVLKALITESHLTIEAKHANAVQMPNYLHVMMASNEEWVVPASLDARRFFVLNVSHAHQSDHRYFEAIWAQMTAGGYEAMLHDLLAVDLTHFNVRAVPQTEGLQQQRKLSLATPEAWWRDCLERGYVFRSKLGLESLFRQWHDTISTELLFASYTEFANTRHDRRPMSRENFGSFIRKMGATPNRPRRGIVGEHITDEPNSFGGNQRVAKVVEAIRPPAYFVGMLATARGDFTKVTGLVVDWDDDEDVPRRPAIGRAP